MPPVPFWEKMQEIGEALSPDALRLFLLVHCSAGHAFFADKTTEDIRRTYAVILDLPIERIEDLIKEIGTTIRAWNEVSKLSDI